MHRDLGFIAKEIFMTEKDAMLFALLGERMKFLRDGAGYSLRDAETKTGINNSRIAKIEKGKLTINMRTFFDILQAYQVHPKDFFNNEADWTGKDRTDPGKSGSKAVADEIGRNLIEKMPIPRSWRPLLAKKAAKVNAIEGQVILKPRPEANDLIFVCEGVVEILQKYRKGGENRGFLVAGDIYVGGASAADNPGSFSGLVVCQNATIYRIPGATIEDCCNHSKEFKSFIEANAYRVKQFSFQYRTMRQLRVEERMNWLEENFPKWIDAVPKAKLADYLAVTPEVITKYKSEMPKVNK